MSEIDNELKERRAKRANDDFTYGDLHDYVKEKCEPGARVYVLKKGRWIKVNQLQLLLTGMYDDWESAWIHVVVRPHKPLLNWLLLPLARLRAKRKEVIVDLWNRIPDTDLILEVWFVGDGTGGTPLVVETLQ